MRVFLIGFVVFAALGASACKDDDAPSSVAVEDVGSALADAFCSQLDACLGPLVVEVLGTMDCRTQVIASFDDNTLPQLQEALQAGTAQYDGSAMRACLDDLIARDCALFDVLGPTICVEAFSGTVAVGQPCDQTIECAGDAYCRVEAACPGTCTARLAEGMACVEADACQGGLACDLGTCAARVAEGQPCGGLVAPECQAGLLCQGEDAASMTTGTCVAIASVRSAAVDSPCDIEGLTLCQEGLSCVVTGIGSSGPTLECRAPVSSGGDCFTGLPEMCPTGEYCDANPPGGVFMGTCTASPGEGEACAGTVTGASCAENLACVDDTCQRFRRLGESCTSEGQCFSRLCEGGVCVALGVCEGL